MDKDQENLNRASHVLLDAEVRLRTISVQIQQLDKEIAILTVVEANLQENIRVMKRKRVTVRVEDYKKARSDLNTARTRRAFLRVDRENSLKAERHAEMLYGKAKEEYDKAYDRLKNPPNNVLYVDFGRKDGRQS